MLRGGGCTFDELGHDDCHPPCTYLTNSAAWAYKDAGFARYPGVGYRQQVKPGTLTGAARRAARADAVAFVLAMASCKIPRICIENPIGHLSGVLTLPKQTVQPWWFGDDASKATVLWLYNLPRLTATRHVAPRMVNGRPRWSNQTDNGQNKLSPSDDREMLRSLTYPGLAAAMADQWGSL